MPLPRDIVVLSDEQFGKIVELLTPGYECAMLMLADRQAYSATPETPPITDPAPETEATGGEGQAAAASTQESA